MGLDKIANKTTESQADFKLVASGCSSGISWIDTTLTGNASSSSPKLIIPQSGDSSSTTSNIGMGFKKQTTDDATFWICPYISRHLLSLNPLQARCRRYSRGER